MQTSTIQCPANKSFPIEDGTMALTNYLIDCSPLPSNTVALTVFEALHTMYVKYTSDSDSFCIHNVYMALMEKQRN